MNLYLYVYVVNIVCPPNQVAIFNETHFQQLTLNRLHFTTRHPQTRALNIIIRSQRFHEIKFKFNVLVSDGVSEWVSERARGVNGVCMWVNKDSNVTHFQSRARKKMCVSFYTSFQRNSHNHTLACAIVLHCTTLFFFMCVCVSA